MVKYKRHNDEYKLTCRSLTNQHILSSFWTPSKWTKRNAKTRQTCVNKRVPVASNRLIIENIVINLYTRVHRCYKGLKLNLYTILQFVKSMISSYIRKKDVLNFLNIS